MSGTVKGILVEIGGDTSGLQKALQKVNSSTSSLSKELREINSLLKLDPKNTELVTQKQKVLKDEISKTEDKLKLLKEAQKQADETIASGGEVSQENYRKLQREIVTTETKLKNFKTEASNWTRAGRSIEEFGNKITNISSKLDSIGTTFTTKLTLPILGIATGLVSASKEFETAFTGVEKTVDGTASQIANLRRGILDLAETIPASTTEISAVAEAAGQLGIETDNVLEFTKTMINMGNATNLSADEAATTLARFANVTKMSQSDFGKLGSVIVALGNNFATTEAEIANMGMNLASAGTQVGMSQSEIMALATALSSVGLEAQAGGTAFSKVMVNMQLAVENGGQELKDFASVAGMTTNEFKKAFKENATKAIMKFVDGLSKSGEQGKSAIKILDDMDIKETRLRDALLRSANASDVMSKAIDLGNEAWDENTALTNEAEKRYKTLDSRLEMTKNKIKNVATNTGDKLTPTFTKLLDKVDNLIEKFNGLNEEQITSIIKIAGLVAAIGPALKIMSTLGSGVGAVSKGIGIFSQAIAVAKNGTTSTVPAVNNLSQVLTFLQSGAGIATIGLTALVATMAIVNEQVKKETQETRDFITELDNSVNSRASALESIKQKQGADLAEIENTQKLSDELKTLVDENGKVKEGYEGRAQVILNELNKALGTEYSMTGDIIDKYGELRDEIDKVILKKKASLILESEEAAYKEAISNKTKAYEDYLKTQEELKKVEAEIAEAEGTVAENLTMGAIKAYKKKKKLEELQKQHESLTNSLGDQNKTLGEYQVAIDIYEENCERMLEGSENSLKAIEESVANTQRQITQDANTELSKRISDQTKALEKAKDLYNMEEQYNEDAKNSIYATNVESAKKTLDELKQELKDRTSTVEGELGQSEIEAWKTLANTSREEYVDAISGMDKDMKKKIEDITGVIVNDRSVQSEIFKLGNRAELEIQKKDSKKWGNDLVKGIGFGIQETSNSSWMNGILSSTASKIASYLHFSRPDVGPLREYEEWMPDMIKGLAETLEESSPILANSAEKVAQKLKSEIQGINFTEVKDFGKLQRSLSSKITNSTSNYEIKMNFYPQKMTDTELNNAFNYVNRKMGTLY